jgi:hypothetical protein
MMFLKAIFGINSVDSRGIFVMGDLLFYLSQIVMAYLSYVWPSEVITGSFIGTFEIGQFHSSSNFLIRLCYSISILFNLINL